MSFRSFRRLTSDTAPLGGKEESHAWVVAKGVKVDGQGSFKAAVKVTETRGQVRVSATQKTEKGEELRDERTLTVVSDREEG